MTQSTPNLLMDVPMLVSARNMYTPKIFKLFQEEFESGMNCTATIQSIVENITTYKVYSLKKDRDYIVTFDSLQKTIQCSCKKFEFNGILCGHALKVFVRADFVEVPDKYILKRWRKDVKVSNVNISRLASEDKMATSTRHRELLHDATKFITKAATTQEAYVLAMKLIKNAVEKIEHLQVHPTSTSTFQPVPPQDIGAEPKGDSMEIHILDVDKNIQHTASVPKKNSNKQYIGKSKMKGAKRKEKGLKGEKRKLSALEKAINKRQSSIVGPPMDSESASLNPMNSTPLSDHLSQVIYCFMFYYFNFYSYRYA